MTTREHAAIARANANLDANQWPAGFTPITLEKIENRLGSPIMTRGGNTKLEKNAELTLALTLAPHMLSGFNVCAFAGKCRFSCLDSAGLMGTPGARIPQTIKTLAYFLRPEAFKARMRKDFKTFARHCAKQGVQGYARTNVMSDLDFTDIIREFPTVKAYDYTKNPGRFDRFMRGELPENYWLTRSKDENLSVEDCKAITGRGFNVATVFFVDEKAGDALPTEWHGMQVINGDAHDNRWKDPRGVIVGLKAKGNAKKLTEEAFVIMDHPGRAAS